MNKDNQNKTLAKKIQIREDILNFWKTNQVSPGSLVWSPNGEEINVLTRIYLLVQEFSDINSDIPKDYFNVNNHPTKRGEAIRGLIFESPEELEQYDVDEETDILCGHLIFEFLSKGVVFKSYMLDIWSYGIGKGLYQLANNEEPYIYE
jgi:hypothetical protein